MSLIGRDETTGDPVIEVAHDISSKAPMLAEFLFSTKTDLSIDAIDWARDEYEQAQEMPHYEYTKDSIESAWVRALWEGDLQGAFDYALNDYEAVHAIVEAFGEEEFDWDFEENPL